MYSKFRKIRREIRKYQKGKGYEEAISRGGQETHENRLDFTRRGREADYNKQIICHNY